jgi:large subunit ribosomal protein L21
VPLIGTKTFTLLGRPFITGARVEAIIESISDSDKILVFKKKRRKQYKRSFGQRSSLTQCRITKIVYQLTENILERAIALT